jgi:DNA polymerase-3 subunit delta
LENIYLYLGEETLIIKNKIDRLIKESSAGEFNISNYDYEEVSILEAINDALTPPFMSDIKVVILKNPKFLTSEKSLNDLESKKFLEYISQPMDSTVFIINAANLKLDERKEVVKKLRKEAVVNESKELTEIEVTGWIKRQCVNNTVSIKDDAVRTFVRLVGRNLMNAKNELDKLVNYVGPNGVITTEIVNKIVVKEIQNDAFALTNAILEQNKNKIISIYSDLVSLGNDVNYLFSLVSKSMREALLVNLMLKAGLKQADIALKMKVSPGRAYYLVKNAKSLDYEIIRDYVKELGELDYKIKSGQIEIKNGFEFFLFGA